MNHNVNSRSNCLNNLKYKTQESIDFFFYQQESIDYSILFLLLSIILKKIYDLNIK